MPAYVARRGASPADVVRCIRRAGGLASFAHPGKFGDDSVMEPMIDAGLAAVEVFHPDHDEAATARYAVIARARGLAMTGGSDYHGRDSARAAAFGKVHLPQEAYDDFVRRAGRAPAAPSRHE
jgi:predicted metal-dependent phosphoesterase TrpH